MVEENKTVKKKLSLGKTLLFASVFASGVFLGDYFTPITKSFDFVKYYNVSAEDNTVKDFKNYKTKILINDKGRAELYFGNVSTNKFLLVKPDGTVGTLGSSIDNYIREKKQSMKDWYDDHFKK